MNAQPKIDEIMACNLMARNFPASVEDAAFKRAAGCCEDCGGQLKGNKFQYDHVKSHAMGGKSTLENCKVLCTACHIRKTLEDDMPTIRRADKQGKVKRELFVASGVSEIARRFGIKA